MAKELIKKFSIKGEYSIGRNIVELTSSVHVYKETKRNWLGNLKTNYTTKFYIPYVNDPYWDGEYAANRKLDCVRVMLNQQVEEYIAELKYQDSQKFDI